MTQEFPEGLESVDPNSRFFPPSWKDAAIRLLYCKCHQGVLCVRCNTYFRGKDLKKLQADHIKAWSSGGKTEWENMQLLCSLCNLRKLNASR